MKEQKEKNKHQSKVDLLTYKHCKQQQKKNNNNAVREYNLFLSILYAHFK